MNTRESLMPRSVLGFGIITGICLIAYFMLMRAFGLIHVMELRYFNMAILLIGIISAMNYRATKVPGFTYLDGIGQGFGTAVIACAVFCFFVYTYLTIDRNFMLFLQENAMFGQYLTPQTASGVIAIEGLASGAITTFVAMQYFKRFIFNN